MYRARHLLHFCAKNCYSTKSSLATNVIEHLKDRTLLRISGNEVVDYLQGLITNDVRHIEHGGCMYSVFLNTKGRILYDTIIYKTETNNTYFIECDKEAVEALEKHLKVYRIRRKIDISSLTDDYEVFALFKPESQAYAKKHDDLSLVNEGLIVPCNTLNETLPENVTTTRTYKDILIYRDPRISFLGSRIISPKNRNVPEQLAQICTINDKPKPEENYRWLRYTLGVGEGVNDLPPGNCFPLEANCDYLHGVSFHKGCYIGQELTARTHHTGVVRKRLMPLIFSEVPGKVPENDNVMHDNVNLGKLRGIEGNAGLGLLRIAKCLDLKDINIGNGVAHTFRPAWWPIEAPKEKMSLQRNE